MISPNLTIDADELKVISMVSDSGKSVRRYTYYDHQYKQTDTQRPYITWKPIFAWKLKKGFMGYDLTYNQTLPPFTRAWS